MKNQKLTELRKELDMRIWFIEDKGTQTVEVKEKHVVYDNATGRWGFLSKQVFSFDHS